MTKLIVRRTIKKKKPSNIYYLEIEMAVDEVKGYREQRRNKINRKNYRA